MVKSGQYGEKWSKLPKMVKIAKNGQNCLKWFKLVENGEKWSKLSKLVKIAKNGQNCQKLSKWSKIVQNDPTWSRMVQNGENG